MEAKGTQQNTAVYLTYHLAGLCAWLSEFDDLIRLTGDMTFKQ